MAQSKDISTQTNEHTMNELIWSIAESANSSIAVLYWKEEGHSAEAICKHPLRLLDVVSNV